VIILFLKDLAKPLRLKIYASNKSIIEGNVKNSFTHGLGYMALQQRTKIFRPINLYVLIKKLQLYLIPFTHMTLCYLIYFRFEKLKLTLKDNNLITLKQ